MPFKLKLKKSRQYNVVSKSLFVVSIELLDGVIVECTLAIESTGQECLDNVCQRLVINQPEFFGLRYLNRSQQPRWIQLERPLKRQLEKNASSHQLHLRVMYYVVSGTSLITDEMTRLHYFLQLKNDLLEGKIVCDCHQAVILASYSRQAEYGNHDCERHTVEYLKNLLTFPKQMIEGGQIIDSNTLAASGRLECLTAAVIQQHQSLHNMSQAQAEEGYINVCQQLSGYGQETFVAREQRGAGGEVLIAISLTGIMVATENNEVPHTYRWTDITNVINHKRTFSIECQNSADNATFVLPSQEDGKYIWRLCVLQHTFYMLHKQNMIVIGSNKNDIGTNSCQIKFQDCVISEGPRELKGSMPGFLDVSSRGNLSSHPLEASQRAHSTSCIDIASSNNQLHQPQDLERLKALLPSYRAAPDYETAIQQKMQESRNDALRYPNHQHQERLTKPPLYGSHPDIHRPIHYPDVTRHTNNLKDYNYGMKFIGQNPYPNMTMNRNVQHEGQMQFVNVYKAPPPYPSNVLTSNSTPDLAIANQPLNCHRNYMNAHVTGSSPDLVSNRSIVNRAFLNCPYNPAVHGAINYRHMLHSSVGTYSNLAAVLDIPSNHIFVNPQIGSSHQNIYEDRSNIMCSVPQPATYQRVVTGPSQTISIKTPHEPIYENVPLPWPNVRESPTRPLANTSQDIIKINSENDSKTATDHTDYSNDHYVNAPIIKEAIEASREGRSSQILITDNNDNLRMNQEPISIIKDERNKCEEESPYQSISSHQLNVSNSNNASYKELTQRNMDNVTSITISEPNEGLSFNSNKTYYVKSANDDENNRSCLTNKSAIESGLTSDTSLISSTRLSNTLDSSLNTTKSGSVCSKEKKRRRWGMFMGRSDKNGEVKSATLGREKGTKNTTSIKVQADKFRWSTGLPKLPPTIESLCEVLERNISDSTYLSYSFERISKGREVNGEMTTALLPEYGPHNGFSVEHLPYEENRFRLSPTVNNRHGYVNASHVTMSVGGRQRFYVVSRVACEMETKRRDSLSERDESDLIWNVVWHSGSRLIALISSQQHPLYLPETSNEDIVSQQFEVRLETLEKSAFGFTSRVRLKRIKSHETRTIWHIQYAHWPASQATASSPQTFLDFVSELRCLRIQISSETLPPHNPNTPAILCDSKGGGRAGTLLAIDLLTHTLDHNQELDIAQTISTLNHQRANMIENIDQYTFIHRVLLQYLKHVRLI